MPLCGPAARRVRKGSPQTVTLVNNSFHSCKLQIIFVELSVEPAALIRWSLTGGEGNLPSINSCILSPYWLSAALPCKSTPCINFLLPHRSIWKSPGFFVHQVAGVLHQQYFSATLCLAPWLCLYVFGGVGLDLTRNILCKCNASFDKGGAEHLELDFPLLAKAAAIWKNEASLQDLSVATRFLLALAAFSACFRLAFLLP